MAASLLQAVGLPELVAATRDDYMRMAVELARDRAALGRLRTHLEGPGRASALFDTAATTTAIEAAYLMMADQCRRRIRAPFRVVPSA